MEVTKERLKDAFKKLGYIISDNDTIKPGFHGSDPLVYDFLGAWDLVNNVLICYEPGTGNIVQEILPNRTYVIKQVHTFAMYYEVMGRSPNDALIKLQSSNHDPIEQEFLFMNDMVDWEVSSV